MRDHIDAGYIKEKIAGHGGSYSYQNPKGWVKIGYIGGASRVRVIWYNIMLLVRYIQRKVKGEV